ncbi:MAG: cytochrome c [Bacteroidetes bacterium]|nr:MAG: cytochrome c [Bacteroidota bacterium]MBL1144432.1 cytochrome c [Bacteroidota bacterium]MCB0802141.1 c-type cytochrome [Flavobacteriales bacterium]NOG57226.1 c-type cytochrome [Bacteroidota bacterium]
MRLSILLVVILALNSCITGEKTEVVVEKGDTVRGELSLDSKIFLGNRLFSEKTCITCHDIDKNKIGPSVIDIMNIYKDKNGSIVSFLKGKSEPIVDTTASNVAIMQDNIDGFLKEISDEELDAIATYMMHVTELKKL